MDQARDERAVPRVVVDAAVEWAALVWPHLRIGRVVDVSDGGAVECDRLVDDTDEPRVVSTAGVENRDDWSPGVGELDVRLARRRLEGDRYGLPRSAALVAVGLHRGR
jgi:hypothetical protein